MLGLNREEDREREAKAARKLELGYPVLLGMDEAFEAYWINGLPATLLIDRKGILRQRWSGYGKGMEEELAQAIEALLVK